MPPVTRISPPIIDTDRAALRAIGDMADYTPTNTAYNLAMLQESDTSRDLNINILISRVNEKYAGSGGGGKSPQINIGEAVLNQSQFTYYNQYRDSIRTGFNYNQFSVAIDEAELESFVVLGDTTEFNVRTMIANDIATGFSIKQLSTFFRLSQGGMEFMGLDLRAGESIIKDTIVFTFKRQLDLNDFISKVKVDANLSNTIIPHLHTPLIISRNY